jgi:periplasmic copper chaperone A
MTPHHHRHRGPRWPVAAALVAATLLTAGCGSDAPLQTPGAEVAGGAIGPDAAVSSDIKVLAVRLEYPEDGLYAAGEDADLHLGISNTGTTADTLVSVTGPDFAGVRSSGAGDAARLAIAVPTGDNVYIGAEGGPALTLLDLGRPLRSSQSIPVTFVFERAGSVTVDAVVAAAGQPSSADVDSTGRTEAPTS